MTRLRRRRGASAGARLASVSALLPVFFAVSAFLAFAPWLHAAPAPTTPQTIRAAGVLRWGGDQQGGEPFAFEDPEHPGTLVGFEVEIAAALARYLNVRPVFVQNDWSTLIPSLERGSFDIALNGVEVTAALRGRVAFSRPYFIFTERLVARAGDKRISDLASLRGLRVGTLASTQAWYTLQAAGAQAVPYEGVAEPFIDLENGRTDAVLLDDIIVDRYAPEHSKLQVVGDLAEGRYAVALRPADSELRIAINDALEVMLASGELRRIFAKWNIDGPWQARLALESAEATAAAEAAGTPLVRAVPGGPAPAEVAARRAGRRRRAATDRRRPPATMTPTRPRLHRLRPRPRFSLRHFGLFLQGALVTLLVSVGAMALAVPFGLLLALARLYAPRARPFATAYIEVFRGTPVLLQLYLLYYGLAPLLRLDAMVAAIVGLGLNYAAYEAEIHRAGIAAVPAGQLEAALSLGMPRRLALRRVVLPQAFRVALPGMTNDFIALLKDSSLVSVITVVELTKRMSITAVDTRGWLLPGLACAALYFAMSYPLSRLARRLERRLG